MPHRYAFDASASFAGTVSIQAADRAGNTVTSNLVLIHDTVPPTMTLDANAEGLTLSLAWSAGDAEAGLKACTLEVLTGNTASTVSTECAGNLSYPAMQDASYTVRLTASDNVSNQVVQERAVTVSSVTKYYYHGTTRVAMRKGGQLYYLHGDHLGSTSLTTDSSGKVVHDARYLPYGQVRWESGTATTDLGFTGQRNEANFGLMDYNARYYNPHLGAFIQADTLVPDLSKGQDFNRYLYTRGNPLRYVDPTGHCPECPQQDAGEGGRTPSALSTDVQSYILFEMKVNIRSAIAAEIRTNNFLSRLGGTGGTFLRVEAYVQWANQVGYGNPWDHKDYVKAHYERTQEVRDNKYKFDLWSNIHFGYVGKSVSFTDDELFKGAGIAQFYHEVKEGFSDSDYVKELKDGTAFAANLDHPQDQVAIKFGIHLWDTYGEKLTEEIFLDELERWPGLIKKPEPVKKPEKQP